MPSFIAVAQAGDGQTVQTDPLSITVPSSGPGGTVVANMPAVLYVDIGGSQTCATPAGWSVLSGPDDVNGGNATTYAFGKNLASGDIGNPVSLDLSASARVVAEMQVFSSDVTITGATVATPLITTSATGNYNAPSLAGVAAGSMLSLGVMRRRSGAAGNITVNSPYTETAAVDAGTAYGSGVNVFETTAYRAASGSVGGEAPAATSGVTSIGTVYLIALPPAQTDANIPIPSAFVPARSTQVTPVAHATQQIPSAFLPVRTQDVAVTADTALQVPSGYVQAWSDPAAPGTALAIPSAFVPVRTQDVGLIGDVAVPIPTAFVRVPATSVGLAVDLAIDVPTALITARADPPRPATFYRYQIWDGTEWVHVLPLVWDGTSWTEVPVTILEPDRLP